MGSLGISKLQRDELAGATEIFTRKLFYITLRKMTNIMGGYNRNKGILYLLLRVALVLLLH
jgi:hypothetical protein